jgi:aminopeptidase N
VDRKSRRIRRATIALMIGVALGAPGSLASAAQGAAPPPQPVAVAPTPGSPGAGDPYFPTYGNGGYDARHYDLRVRYDPDSDVLSGRARIRATALQDLSRFDLDLVALNVRQVTVDGRRAAWSRQGDQELVVTPPRPLRRGRSFTVRVRYDGTPVPFADPNLGTYGFLTTSDGAIAIGEPQVAAHWYPVNDHPSDKATYRIALTVPRGIQTVSNGLPTGPVVHGRWATTTWRVRDPMASYLAFLAVGRFDLHRWTTASGLPVLDAVDSGITGPLRARIESSFARQGEILEAESGWFGRYPYEAAGGMVDDVPVAFALENQTRPTYSPRFWNIPSAPTLGDVVVAHELAHQWYGDSVALKRWQDIWLNEGFATYAEWLWTQREFQFTPQETFDALYARPDGDPFWHLKIGDPKPNRMFDEPVYVRGAMTLQALRMTVGDRTFFRILRSWARQHRNGNGTTAGFVALSERVSGRSLDSLFDAWLFTDSKPPRPPASAGLAAGTPRGRTAQVAQWVDAWSAGLRRRLATAPGGRM